MRFIFRFILIIAPLAAILHGAKVYLVIGSDTAIWDGMNTGRYACDYNPALYVDPGMNGYAVMDRAWREQIRDSNGRPIVLTWWMMAGNIFRYAVDLNVPVPNIQTLYLMKKYHGNAIAEFGDELSLHYHTFIWKDYNGDGRTFWNQALDFNECRDDFDVTLAQFLLEEGVFPVSFRSGWHYMDNNWQAYLDRLLPYSMHDDWPNVHTDIEEPTDNNYDWGISPSDFAPWHPAPEDYRVPGDGMGWNLRSTHLYTARYKDLLDSLFIAADTSGEDQIICFWGHLPETDFLENIEILGERASRLDSEFPNVTFEYVTAIEGMQKYLGSSDSAAPFLTMDGPGSGVNSIWTVSSDEDIFQDSPKLAYLDIYGNYGLLHGTLQGGNIWHYELERAPEKIVKWAVTASDAVGNQAILADSASTGIFTLDDELLAGSLGENWNISASNAAWDMAYRSLELDGETQVLEWPFEVPETANYELSYLWPSAVAACDSVKYELLNGGIVISGSMHQVNAAEWQIAAVAELASGDDHRLRITFYGGSGERAIVDALRISSYVPPTRLVGASVLHDLGELAAGTEYVFDLPISNRGYNSLTINNIRHHSTALAIKNILPVILGAGETEDLVFTLLRGQSGEFSDTLAFDLDDPGHPAVKMTLKAVFSPWFTVIDNEDSENYSEIGEWHNSVAEAYGSSSRYIYQNVSGAASASFITRLPQEGHYNLSHILPETVNAASNAGYSLFIDGNLQKSWTVDQNRESGDWVQLQQFYLPENKEIMLKITKAGIPEGAVLRADAIRYDLIDDLTELHGSGQASAFKLEGNFPNPFNAVTKITYKTDLSNPLRLSVYDINGRLIISREVKAGTEGRGELRLDLSFAGSGIYFYVLQQGPMVKKGKMTLLK